MAIVVQVDPPLVEASHRTILPVYPPKVNVPLFEPVHTVVTSGESVPPFGPGITVTVTVSVSVQPFADVPVTVYTVVIVGDALTAAPIVEDNPVAGLQL